MLSIEEMQECIDKARAEKKRLAGFVCGRRDGEFIRGINYGIEFLSAQLQAKITEKVENGRTKSRD